MTADEASGWSFTPDLLTDSSDVRCNVCQWWKPLADWKLGGVYCEDCRDEHSAMVCPKCNHSEDHVWSSDRPMQVRPTAMEGKP